ncbi:XAP5, circadian clock regulator-domain-containing protein [Pseudomassariella vexata]|uniref:XAP5, circadian clock regulator-domain-containing protein n=1 Tax=Pseudomassariella vexata TaxID=1141098 RepID=A0A1Y2DKC9_9PEZI|nr:XAP5, circadian clock regulator-domain-containing protein [Pseudomassariella vexata]ORY59682.1 XAP5, circadian clock regulator-domain-containing protein [Pseudomassariella vexata]
MSNPDSRFASTNQTTQERLTTNTVGLVALSDFRKRRAEVIEQQERELREAAATGTNGSAVATPDRSQTGTPDPNASETSNPARKKVKRRKAGAAKLSFGDDENNVEETEDKSDGGVAGKTTTTGEKKIKFKANSSVSVIPRAMTKSALRREAEEREVLRKEFLAKQEAVKATDIAVPFVFYDGTNIPGGTVRVKKGDYIWVFLDKSRKVGAELGVGEKANARREWARVGVDDLMLVRGNVIIPHHYEFLFFIMNKSKGPGGRLLFDYSIQPASQQNTEAITVDPLSTAASRAAKSLVDVSTLEGASDEAAFTKVVDRRWYERNKHIYPASVWQEFDPEKNYQIEVRRDLGGNTFFYS